MQIKRAQEIMAAPEKIEVVYREEPVWLEDIMNNGNAYITVVGSCRTMEVPVAELVETGKME
ncbi:MAG: small, acid-soluble spore protein, H family [Dethiobacter sp.]|jgi:H-type small acid-soluble spore protein|nr:small, acid-soluble spore protein, H family [Dethiobacter sp.]